MNPRTDPIWKIVAETDNIDYFISHACIVAQEALLTINKIEQNQGYKVEAERKLIKATRLLTLARFALEQI